MSTHQLINLNPLARVTTDRDGFPARRSVGDPASWTAPEGCRYAPVLPVPDHDPKTHRAVPHLTSEADGWTLEELGPQPPRPISKLTLKRRLDAMGKWPAFKAFLQSVGDVAVDEFNLAAEIRPNDPMFQQLAPLAKSALGLSDEQYEALLTA
jgi:hypothetical protein